MPPLVGAASSVFWHRSEHERSSHHIGSKIQYPESQHNDIRNKVDGSCSLAQPVERYTVVGRATPLGGSSATVSAGYSIKEMFSRMCTSG